MSHSRYGSIALVTMATLELMAGSYQLLLKVAKECLFAFAR